MKFLNIILVALVLSCSNDIKENNKLDDKGFQAQSNTEIRENNDSSGINHNTIGFETRPGQVLFTGIPNIRITSVFKVNIKKKDNTTFIGSNNYHINYRYEDDEINENYPINNWHNNIMPGFEASYGYNMVNISHYNVSDNTQKNFFEHPVLINTLYFPSNSKDTLNNKPIQRNYFMVSVYNEDTNKDGFVNLKDLRRMYLFNLNGEKQNALIPENYAIIKSEYDPENDYMYVYAKLDSNNNGQRDEYEAIHIFWINLKDPTKTGRML